jgi:hypothetical protein
MREKGNNFAKCAKNEGCDFVKGKSNFVLK